LAQADQVGAIMTAAHPRPIVAIDLADSVGGTWFGADVVSQRPDDPWPVILPARSVPM
jgi:hypothetical protein